MEQDNNVTVLFIGDTGSGKSATGNLYLKSNAFDTSEKPDACTLFPAFHHNKIDGITRCVIDTEGFDDKDQIPEDQIQRLTQMLRCCDLGINAIVIVVPAHIIRITKGVKNDIKFVYDAFGKNLLAHLCIMFTFCSKKFPDRKIKKTEYKRDIIDYLKEISKEESIPDIPLYYINARKPEKDFVIENMNKFHNWALGLPKFKSSVIKDASFGYTMQKETETKVSLGTFTEGKQTFEKFCDRARLKFISNTSGEMPSYSNWTTIKEYKEVISEISEEKKLNEFLAYTYEDGIKYEVLVDRVREIITNYRTGEITRGEWGEINRRKRRVSSNKKVEVVYTRQWIERSGKGHKTIKADFQRKVFTSADGEISVGEKIEIPGTRTENFFRPEPVIIYEDDSCRII